MDPKNPLDKAALTAVAKLAADVAALKKVQLETIEALANHLPAFRDEKTVALLSELEQGLAHSQTLAEAAKKLKESLEK